ncbi:hypothetical protein [Nostoc sp.]|uniref:hypothetical protein n=1 Tax=Nostoc sp. TaxID=1180 RepID=UPI002FF8582F
MSSDKLFHVYAHQIQGQVEQDYSATLSGENQVFSVEVKGCHEATCSAAPVPNPEKWSHEVIVAFVKYATGGYAETQGCGKFGAESRIGLLARVLE